MSQHTAGPWRVDFNRYDEQWRVYEDRNGRDAPIVNALFKSKGPEAAANAHLIAAAPDMLAALQACENALRSYQYGNTAKGLAEEVADAAHAAIAKATEAA